MAIPDQDQQETCDLAWPESFRPGRNVISLSRNHLTLRSIAQRCVSKGGNAHLACCPSFETRRFAALLRMR